MDSLENCLNMLRIDYKILDIEMQTQEATKEYVRSNTNKKTIASELLKNLENSGGEFIQLQDHLDVTNEAYNEIKLKYETSLSDLSKELTYTNIVSKPVPADKKSYPVRWLIVMLSVVASLFLTIVVIVIVEKFSEAIEEFSKD